MQEQRQTRVLTEEKENNKKGTWSCENVEVESGELAWGKLINVLVEKKAN